MSSLREKILAESRAFRAAVPSLTSQFGGKWVVFRDGKVQSAHDDEESAFQAGIKQFGVEGGHVVVQVVPQETQYLSAAVVFGL